MKNKELKSILKSEANKIEINDYSEDILLKVNPNKNLEEPVKTRKHSFFNLKIAIPSLCSALVVLIIALFMIFRTPTNPVVDGDDIKPNYTLTRAKTLIGKEILAGSSIIDGSINYQQFKHFQKPMDYDIYLEEAKSIHKYLKIGEMLLDNEKIKIEVNENKDFEYEAYKIKMIVSFENENLSKSYIFYYNETANIDISDTDDMDEVNSLIEGIILMDGKTYKVTGFKEVEDDEYETSLKLMIDEKNYILVNQETEINENEYEYIFVENGKKVKELSQEFNKSKNTVEIEAKEYNGTKPTEYEMEFVFNSDGNITCEYEKEIEEEEIEFDLLIVVKEDYYEYRFKDGLLEHVVNLKK